MIKLQFVTMFWYKWVLMLNKMCLLKQEKGSEEQTEKTKSEKPLWEQRKLFGDKKRLNWYGQLVRLD